MFSLREVCIIKTNRRSFFISWNNLFSQKHVSVSKIGIHTASNINVNQANRDSIFMDNNAKDNQYLWWSVLTFSNWSGIKN